MADSAQDKKLPATERRIQKAREEGQVARSRDLGHLTIMCTAVGLFAYGSRDAVNSAGQMLRAGLKFDAQSLGNPLLMLEQMATLGSAMLTLLLPLLAVLSVLTVLTTILAGGWNFTWQPLQPKFSKINPISGVARMFSLQNLTDTLKACLLALLLVAVGAWQLYANWAQYAELLALPLPAALPKAGGLVLGGLLPLAGLLAAFALVDIPLQRFQLQKRLRMSLQEVKQEMKEVEGNPHVKQQIKARMREMSNRRMMAAVPTADLVVMNPSHYAVALKYDETSMAAPRVVAKGMDLVAMRIRDLAVENGVTVLQSPALARALYAHTEVDHEVPTRLFSAVAQVLAWVFQLRQAMAAGRQAYLPTPQPEVPADLDPANQPASTGTAGTMPEADL